MHILFLRGVTDRHHLCRRDQGTGKRKSNRSIYVPWTVKCSRVEHVYSVNCFGSENWSGSLNTLDGIKGWETKAVGRLFRLKKRCDVV